MLLKSSSVDDLLMGGGHFPIKPFSAVDPLAGLGWAGPKLNLFGMPSMGAGSETPSMSPQEEKAAVKALGTGLQALGAVGSLLDVPGAVVRNAVMGKPLVEPILNPLTSVGRSTGRDILKKYGIMGDTPAGLPWYSPERIARAAAGIGAEVLLDPLFFLRGAQGAATVAGTAMQALGKPALQDLSKIAGTGWRQVWVMDNALDILLKGSPNAAKYTDLLTDFAAKNRTTLDALRTQPLGRALGVHIPFGPTIPIPSPLDALARQADAAAKMVRESAPMRAAFGLLDPKMMGATGRTMQAATPKVFHDTLDMAADARSKMEPHLTQAFERGWVDPVQISKSPVYGGNLPLTQARHIADDVGDAMMSYVELGHKGYTPDWSRFPHLASADHAAITNMLDEIGNLYATDLARMRALGGRVGELNHSILGYAYRETRHRPVPPLQAPHRVLKTEEKFMRGRHPSRRYIPTELLNRISVDPDFSGFAHGIAKVDPAEIAKRAAAMQAKYEPEWAKYLPTPIQDPATGKTVPGTKVSWRALATWAGWLDPWHHKNRIPVYRTDPIQMATRRLEASAQVQAAMRGVYDILHDNAVPDAFLKQGAPTHTSVWKAIGNTPGMDRKHASLTWLNEWIGKHGGDPGVSAELAALETRFGPLDATNVSKWANHISIPTEVANDMGRVMSVFSEPEAAKGVVGLYDQLLNSWRKWVTVPWLPFHTRNLISGLTRNWVAGHADPVDYGHATQMIFTGGLGQGAAKRFYPREAAAGLVDDATASLRIRNEVFAQNLVSHRVGSQSLDNPLGGQLVDVPGVTKMLQPSMQVGDVSTIGKGTDAWQRAGGMLSYWVESENRIAAYLNMRAKGYSPAAAADKVRALQIAYDKLFQTDVDKYLRRIFPFWVFNKGVVAWTLKDLIERPGGPLSQIAKRTAMMRSDDPLLPEQVQRTAAIRLPADQPGGMKFLSTLGFMEEPFYAFAAPMIAGPLSVAENLGVPIMTGTTPGQALGDFLREGASMMAPPLKAIPEWMFGRSTFFGGGEPGGRPLGSITMPTAQLGARIRELVPQWDVPQLPTALTMPLQYGVGMTPLSRPISMVNTLLDPRLSPIDKLINLGTGLKITDVSPAQVMAQKNEMLTAAMQRLGARTFVKPYFRPEDLALMPSADRRRAETLNTLGRWWAYKRRQEQKAGT